MGFSGKNWCNFNIQANVKTKDEVGLLAKALNQLITQVKNLLAE